MTVLSKLASALDRRDEVPNEELAAEIAATADKEAVKELVENMANKSKAIQNDCIKVLYEVGEKQPKLIAPYLDDFTGLLHSKNNRLQWGSMMALNTISTVRPDEIYAKLSHILRAAEKGSVITRDHAVNLLINLARVRKYTENAFSLLIEQLKKSPVNQLPMYAERALSAINDQNQATYIKTLKSRLGDIEKESKRKRVEKVIRKLEK